jgi:hypothetical protein
MELLMKDIVPISLSGAKILNDRIFNSKFKKIIKVVNKLIIKYYDKHYFNISQKEIVELFLKENKDYKQDRIFEERLLDFEKEYKDFEIIYIESCRGEKFFEPYFQFKEIKC